jgi:hypothetical protein
MSWTSCDQLPQAFQQPAVTDTIADLSPADAKFALDELNEVPEQRVEKLTQVRAQLRAKFTPAQFEELMIRDDFNWLVRFARGKKWNVDKTVGTLVHLYNFRADKGYTWSARPPLHHFTVIEMSHMTLLPKPDKSGCTVMLVEAKKIDMETITKALTHDQLQHVSFYQMLAWLSIENVSIRGLSVVQDISGVSLWSMLKLGGGQANMHKAQQERMQLMNGGLPIRVKCVLMVEPPMWIRAMMKMASVFMSAKMRRRIHTVSREEIADWIDVDLLPPQFLKGGDAEATAGKQSSEEDDG